MKLYNLPLLAFAFSLIQSTAALAANPSQFYDRQNFSGLVHATDLQWAFAMRANHPYADQTANGTLAVLGTELTIPTITSLVDEVLKSGIMKLSLSADSHLMTEVNDPAQNGEFHAPQNFPVHAMRG